MTKFCLFAAGRCAIAGAFSALSTGFGSEIASEPLVPPLQDIRVNAGIPLRFQLDSDYRGSVRHLVASEGSLITLVGRMGVKFVLNISGDFDLSGTIVDLEGGLRPADVVFNLTSTSVHVRRRIIENSSFFGNIVTSGIPLTLSHSSVNGRIVTEPIEKVSIAPLMAPPKPRGPVGP